MNKTLIFATNNSHKLREARAILGDNVKLLSLAELGCEEELPETSATLEGNALQKAHRVYELYGADCIADDTGLMVDALNGAPGVYSARYAGPGHDSKANMARLLDEMKDKENRKAHFSTVLALVTAEGEKTFEGRVDGTIATTPAGEAGFGYDPIFIADETGETFARMGEEAKNEISHRGRAFRKLRDWLTAMVVMMLLMIGTPQAAALQWRQHPSFDEQALRILPGDKYTYFLLLKQQYAHNLPGATLRYGQLLRYDNENDEWKWIDKSTGLSENVVVDAIYDYTLRQLVVGYDNGNIDLIKDNGDKINIPGLMGASSASKNIEHLYIDPTDGNVWLTTTSGYVCIDPRKGEVKSSRDYGRNVNAVAKFGDKLYVGADDGLYVGNEKESSLSGFTKMEGTSDILRLVSGGKEKLHILSGQNNSLKHHILTLAEDSDPEYRLMSLSNEYSIERGKAGTMVCGERYVRWFDDENEISTYELPSDVRNATAGSRDGKTVWFNTNRRGISRLNVPAKGSDRWTLTIKEYRPNASNAFQSAAMCYHEDYGMLVRNHGSEQKFLENELPAPDLISGLKGGDWTPLSTTHRINDATLTRALQTSGPNGLAVDPKNPDHVYCGSRTSGLLRLNLAEPEKSMRFSRSNDAANGLPNFVAVTEPLKTWPLACTFFTPVFDSYGNMWVNYHNQDVDTFELWYWTPENRAATTSASNFRPFGKLKINDLASADNGKVLPLTRNGRTNMLVCDIGQPNGPILVLDHGGTLAARNDDKRVVINRFVDQDGTSFTFGYINLMLEDPATGRVWVCTETGVFHFDPKEALDGNTTVRRVKVARNDGTNLADYLLDGAYVTSLTIDKSGRKWFGTLGAGIVMTSADGTEILSSYNTSNSEITDDMVHAIAYNPQNNSMMISTGKGLCEVYMDAFSDGSSSDVRAYPNPVRPGFLGLVTIDNLAEYSMVKIIDASGNVVKELGQATTGEITWDLTSNRHKRVNGGVYYILATNGSDQDSYIKKGKILVIE